MTGKVIGVVLCLVVELCLTADGMASDARSSQVDTLHRPMSYYPALGDVPYPEGNPYTPAKAELGRMLFFDPILSRSGSTSCASCHNPGLSWSDGLEKAAAEKVDCKPRHTPSLIGVAWTPLLGWAGQFPDIEQVTWRAVTSLMDLTAVEAVARVSGIAGYRRAFAAAFGTNEITDEAIGKALATYERGIVPPQAPIDRWLDGDEGAMGPAAKRGFELFNGRAHCADCHSGRTFTDGSFHDIGAGNGEDLGRGQVSPGHMRFAFKVPTLRDVARRAPYMHDGSIPTLEAVIDLYDRGGVVRPSLSLSIRPLGLSGAEKADLIAFLESLTGDPEAVTIPVLPR